MIDSRQEDSTSGINSERCGTGRIVKNPGQIVKKSGSNRHVGTKKVRFPKRPYVRSGYIVLPKTEKKTAILEKISQKLVSKRAKQSKQ